MLEVFRQASKSWIAKVLFGLLIISFAIWGIGDMVRVGVSNAPAVVAGDVEVSADEVVETYRRELQRLQRTFGSQFTEEQARQMGLLERTLDNVVARALLDQAANDLDMTAPTDVVSRQIAANPAFQNQLGQFDPNLFRQAIGAAGFTEARFLATARDDLKRGHYLAALTEGVTAPAPLAAPLFAFRAERRVADTVEFGADKMPVPPAPPESDLKQYWQANQNRFMAPEYRALAAVLLRPADVAADMKIDEQAIADAYVQRQAEFVQHEERTVRQLLLQDQQTAQQAVELIQKNVDFAEAAKQLDHPVLDLGSIDRQALEAISPELAQAVFSVPAGAITQPVQTPLGWHVAQVTEIQPGKERPLAEVREQLIQDIVRERSIDLLYELANKVEDTLAGGASLEEAAQKLNLTLVKAEVDARGIDKQGQPVAELPTSEKFLGTVFSTPSGSETSMTELENGGFFLARVDGVTPPAVRPFDTVEDEVLKAWQAEQQQAAAKLQAEQALAKLQAGEPAEAVAQQLGGAAKVTPPFTRNPQPGTVSPQVAAEAFKLQQGGVAVVPTATGATVVRLQQVQTADPQAEAQTYQQVRQQLGEAMSADLIDQLVAGLNAKYGAKVNRQVIDERMR